jgi:prepilin-type N-terminal cleavage/methylation domain-containing protein
MNGNTFDNSENGYSLIESLMAMAILSFLIISFTNLAVSLNLRSGIPEKITAIELAETAMENCIITQDFYDEMAIVQKGSRKYLVERIISRNSPLITIIIEVSLHDTHRKLFSLTVKWSDV